MPLIAAFRVFQPTSANEGVKFNSQSEVFQSRDGFLKYRLKFDYIVVGIHQKCVKRRTSKAMFEPSHGMVQVQTIHQD